ncbi:hypothetical protein L1049_013616 [Liquidambar formosana]|uniref:Maternal effect embryo arrest 60 n=1 Tax=Liquidambar formosana TaxID=63359 RepID=A0AAP0RP63_LIQFO
MGDASLRKFSTSIHVMALDGIVNVNSLFTFAVFLGLAWYPTTDPKNTLVTSGDATCLAGTAVAEHLIAFHVYSFSSFLFSSLVASALKQALRTTKNGGEFLNVTSAHVNTVALRVGIVISAVGSVFGCVFLMLALVDLVQIKLGTLACWSWYSVAAIGPLVTLVPSALFIYISMVLYAFTR